jgi:excisionase family DNA binding protein
MEKYLSTAEIAIEFRVSRASVRNCIKGKRIRALRVGRKFLVPAVELERLREEGTTKTDVYD